MFDESRLTQYERDLIPLRGDAAEQSKEEMLACCSLGLAGESGEFADHIKKWLFHGAPLDERFALNELGDVLWYVMTSAHRLGFTLEDVMRANVEKLRARYPTGFNHADAATRRDENAGDQVDGQVVRGESAKPVNVGAERERDDARAELASMRVDLAALTVSVESEIAAACEAVRVRAIEECAGRVGERAEQVRRIADEVSTVLGDDTGAILELGRRAADVLDVIANELRALDTTTTTAAAAGAASVQPVDATAEPSAKRARSCNMHDDCDAEDERERASGRPRPAHCSSDDCEDCFGK